MADGQIWAACGAGVSRIKVSSRVGCAVQENVRAVARILSFWWTVTLRNIQRIFCHFSVRWPWLAGCSGERWFFIFARLLGCLSCLPV